MSKNIPKVRFHYGQKDFSDLLTKIVKIKLEEIHDKNHDNKHTVTGYQKDIKE